MSTDIRKPPTEEAADSKAVLAHAFKGKPLDPEVAKRVHERAEEVREELRKKGVTNFTADLLRECRDE
jgi:2-phosphoglycerate kinase